MEDYEPFGPEWEKEMMKLPKRMLVDMLKEKCLEIIALKQRPHTQMHVDSLDIEHKPGCELMQTGAPICTCDAENRLYIPTHENGSIGCGSVCKQCGGNSLSCECC